LFKEGFEEEGDTVNASEVANKNRSEIETASEMKLGECMLEIILEMENRDYCRV
jgi:hypothetical protein